MVMDMEKWCKKQVRCKEDIDNNSWTCTAHMNDNRVFKCPYSSNEERLRAKYPCSDYSKSK